MMTKKLKTTSHKLPPKQEIPPKPREPDLSECCQRNCVNCVFVYYQKALDRWNKKVADIKANRSH